MLSYEHQEGTPNVDQHQKTRTSTGKNDENITREPRPPRPRPTAVPQHYAPLDIPRVRGTAGSRSRRAVARPRPKTATASPARPPPPSRCRLRRRLPHDDEGGSANDAPGGRARGGRARGSASGSANPATDSTEICAWVSFRRAEGKVGGGSMGISRRVYCLVGRRAADAKAEQGRGQQQPGLTFSKCVQYRGNITVDMYTAVSTRY